MTIGLIALLVKLGYPIVLLMTTFGVTEMIMNFPIKGEKPNEKG